MFEHFLRVGSAPTVVDQKLVWAIQPKRSDMSDSEDARRTQSGRAQRILCSAILRRL